MTTIHEAATFALILAIGISTVPANSQSVPTPPAGPGMAGFPGMPGLQEELAIVDRFDRDGDGRLDAEERVAARAWLATQGGARGGMARGGFGGGMPGPGAGPMPPPPGEPPAPPPGAGARSGQGAGGGQPMGQGGRGMRPGGGRGITPGTQGAALTPADVEIFRDEHLYDTGVLRTIFLELSGDDWESELADFKDTDVEIEAVATVDGRTYRGVGVSFRGA
jgi:hypothetical protein